jgi:malonate decarboxylase alpha subunit
MEPAFVETLDAWQLAEQAKMPLPPIMIYGDDVTHPHRGGHRQPAAAAATRSVLSRRCAASPTTPRWAWRDRRPGNLRDRGVIQRAEASASTRAWRRATARGALDA